MLTVDDGEILAIGGLLDELGCDALEAVLDPEPGLCCVKARRI